MYVQTNKVQNKISMKIEKKKIYEKKDDKLGLSCAKLRPA